MHIMLESLLSGAARAEGSVIVIDVFRAFTTAAVALANGASKIIMISKIEDAIRLRDSGNADLCMGEVHGRKPANFDFGNSPSELIGTSLQGKTIAQRTSAGTQGIVAATAKSEHLFAASLVTATATARASTACGSNLITIVAMGEGGEIRATEDEICALHLRDRIEGRPGDRRAIQRMILASREAARFRDPTKAHMPKDDLQLSLDIDRYDFAIRVNLQSGYPIARKEEK